MAISSYYNYQKLLSHNATINGVVGGRGLGKTFGGKEKGIRDSLKSLTFTERTEVVKVRGHDTDKLVVEATDSTSQFIYLRRYKPELALAKATFFSDIEFKFPDWDFRVRGWEAQASPRKYSELTKGRPWGTIGYFVALSVAQNYKSVQFPNVKLVLYDEFIIERGGIYLPDEASKFINFMNTVDRSKDKTRVILMANSVSIANPYFIHYKVDPDKVDKNGFIKIGGGYMLWHFPEAEDFKSEVLQTKFGKFIAATDPEYTDYAVGNQFKDNNKNLVDGKPSSAKYLLTLESRAGVISIWYDMSSNMYFCQSKRPKANEEMIVIDEVLMSEGKRLMTFSDGPLKMLRTAFRQDRVRVDSPSTRNTFLEIFKR